MLTNREKAFLAKLGSIHPKLKQWAAAKFYSGLTITEIKEELAKIIQASGRK